MNSPLNFGKWLVSINGILFFGFGLGFVVAPSFFYGLFTGGALTTASAAIDVRATYGGLSLGLGAWFFLCAKENVRLGLLGSLLLLVPVVLGRAVGMVADGTPNSFMYAFLAAEITFLIGYALRSAEEGRQLTPASGRRRISPKTSLARDAPR